MVCLTKAVKGLTKNQTKHNHAAESVDSIDNVSLLRSWWEPINLCGFIPISGPFNLLDVYANLKNRGLDCRILDWIF